MSTSHNLLELDKHLLGRTLPSSVTFVIIKINQLPRGQSDLVVLFFVCFSSLADNCLDCAGW